MLFEIYESIDIIALNLASLVTVCDISSLLALAKSLHLPRSFPQQLATQLWHEQIHSVVIIVAFLPCSLFASKLLVDERFSSVKGLIMVIELV